MTRHTALLLGLGLALLVGCGGSSDDDGINNDPGPDDVRGDGGEARTLKCPNGDAVELPKGMCSWAVCGDEQSGLGVKTGDCQGKFGSPYAFLSGDSPGFYVLDTEGFESEFQAIVDFHQTLMPFETTSEEKVAECETGITEEPGALPGVLLEIVFRGPEACETATNTCETLRLGIGSVTLDGCNPIQDYTLTVEGVGTNEEEEVHEVTMTIGGQAAVVFSQNSLAPSEGRGEATFMLQLTDLPDDRRFLPSGVCDSTLFYNPLFDVSNIRIEPDSNGCNITPETIEGAFTVGVDNVSVQMSHSPPDPQLYAISSVSDRYEACEDDSVVLVGGGDESVGSCNVGIYNEFLVVLEDPTVALQDNRTLEVTLIHEEREEDEFGFEAETDLQCPGAWSAPLPCTSVVQFTLTQKP
jgi:hypothetical protein